MSKIGITNRVVTRYSCALGNFDKASPPIPISGDLGGREYSPEREDPSPKNI